MPGEGDREAGDAARAALDEDRLALLQLERVLERDHCGESGKRHGGALDMGEGSGLARDDRLPDGDVLGVGAFLRYFADGEDLVAHLEVARAFAERRDDAGKIAARHVRK